METWSRMIAEEAWGAVVRCYNRTSCVNRARVEDKCKASGLTHWEDRVVTVLAKTFREQSLRDVGGGTDGNHEFRIRSQREKFWAGYINVEVISMYIRVCI